MSENNPRPWIVLLVALFAMFAVGWLASSSTTPAESETPAVTRKAVHSDDLNSGRDVSIAQATPTPAPTRAPDDDPNAEQSRMLDALRHRLTRPNVVPGEALLTFRNKAALDRFTQQAALMGMRSIDTIPELNAARVRYGTVEALRDGIAAMGTDAIGVEGNLWLKIPDIPPQADANNQEGTKKFGQDMMSDINASGDRTHWGDGVTVAVLDSGVLAHPTFAAGQVAHLDLLNDGLEFNSHGTSVASLIGGQNPQAPGVAPGAKLLDIRVINTEGYTVSSILAQGIIEATDRGAQVINLSLGGYGDSGVLEQAVDYASKHGSVVVAAAGNEAYDQLSIPAAYSNVISVGSVDANGKQAYFSNSGQGLALTAPGVGVITAWDTDKIALASGTSQSSAIVAAAAAAYIGWGVSPDKVAARLEADARPTGAPATQVGAGVLTIKRPTGR